MMFENNRKILLIVFITTLSRAVPVCELEDEYSSKRLTRIYHGKESEAKVYSAGDILNLDCPSDSPGEMEEVELVCESTGHWREDVVKYKSCPIPMYNNTEVIQYDGRTVTLACMGNCQHQEQLLNLTCGSLKTGSRTPPNSKGDFTTPECMCPCNRVRSYTVDLKDKEKIKQTIQEIKRLLKTEKNLTSSFLRKHNSAKDQRPSATGVGVVFGATVIVIIFCVVLFIDFVCFLTQFNNVGNIINMKASDN